MKQFKRILVGVDLSWGDRFVTDKLTPPNEEAVRQALWLAKHNSATVYFLASLELSAKAQHLIAASDTNKSTLLDEAQAQLDHCVDQARKIGVAAESKVIVGRSWLELIHQVIRGQQDLVVIGTRHLGAVEGALLGSTGMRLLRKCPCPVWVTQPLTDGAFDSILVADDLRPVGDLARELGTAMAQLYNAQLHIVHAADPRELGHVLFANSYTDNSEEYRRNAENRIRASLAGVELALPPQVHVVTERPDLAILNCIAKNNIDLVVMGMIGRTGIPGFLIGNTAERLLPKIPCSLLAVKPADFKSPVVLPSDRSEDELAST
ncbi:universal stress protein [Adhaeretor mobilis]|uniref:Universal stress protein E n=1 Tax=Adhaeretor mobilis TaxID=1930276 RepID=A0A517MZF3_9BACT|nr:universal stress protein [Adhaeretor mobilis]QDT00234.1 Universal stress protein E [Adhaeretor mobilis]